MRGRRRGLGLRRGVEKVAAQDGFATVVPEEGRARVVGGRDSMPASNRFLPLLVRGLGHFHLL